MDRKTKLYAMQKFEYCPQCGSNKTGSGEGTLKVSEALFTRACKCGYNVIMHERAIQEMKKAATR